MDWVQTLIIIATFLIVLSGLVGGVWAIEKKFDKKVDGLQTAIIERIEKSEKNQDKLRKSELEPIKVQVDNHIPSQIKELRNLIIEYIAKK